MAYQKSKSDIISRNLTKFQTSRTGEYRKKLVNSRAGGNNTYYNIYYNTYYNFHADVLTNKHPPLLKNRKVHTAPFPYEGVSSHQQNTEYGNGLVIFRGLSQSPPPPPPPPPPLADKNLKFYLYPVSNLP